MYEVSSWSHELFTKNPDNALKSFIPPCLKNIMNLMIMIRCQLKLYPQNKWIKPICYWYLTTRFDTGTWYPYHTKELVHTIPKTYLELPFKNNKVLFYTKQFHYHDFKICIYYYRYKVKRHISYCHLVYLNVNWLLRLTIKLFFTV